jgi:hypothetical protein
LNNLELNNIGQHQFQRLGQGAKVFFLPRMIFVSAKKFEQLKKYKQEY